MNEQRDDEILRQLFPKHTKLDKPIMCPYCGHTLRMFHPDGTSTGPTAEEPGFTFCGNCIAPIMFGPGIEPHVMSVEELQAIPEDEREEFLIMYHITRAARMARGDDTPPEETGPKQ